MKILDKYLIKTFAITFTTVFVILFFIFILQTVWLFISELAGKDLDLLLVIKFLMFKMPSLVPLVLPLSVLLASIMSFGDLSEHYEFAAMKSAGISLQRSMKMLSLFILLLAFAAFFFANNVIPYAEYKFINFRKDIAQIKPAMAIAEGQFSDIGSYNIKVDKKSGENGRFLKGITIHKKANNFDGSKNVIRATDGELISNEKSNVLQLVLNNGYYYEDIVPKKYEEKKKVPFAKSAFKKYVINIDLSKLNTNQDDSKVTNTNTMLNLSELKYTIDSLNRNYRKDTRSFSDNFYQRTGLINRYSKVTAAASPITLKPDLLSNFDAKQQAEIMSIANSNIISANFSIESSIADLDAKQKIINSHLIALYDKFVIAFACLMMFFIGAPLGAIIRKGGLGLPIVFAMLIFIIYHFINTFGRKVASENGISPFLGCWMSSFILTPFALLLTYRATNDIGLLNMDIIMEPLQKIYNKIFPTKT